MKKLLSLILVAIIIVAAMPMAFAQEGYTYKVGDIIKFGSYPQSEIDDKALIAELDALAPEWEYWRSYNSSNSTRYTDVSYGGYKYRGEAYNEWSIITWYLFENIEWQVLNPEKGLVVSRNILGYRAFNSSIYYNGEITGSKIFTYFNSSGAYANDYVTSYPRQWLNDYFYEEAFTNFEKNKIATTTLSNKGYYNIKGTEFYCQLDSADTNDKIFLLSYEEVQNSDFRLAGSNMDEKAARFAGSTDYSKYVNNTGWFLRSPGNITCYCTVVERDGKLTYKLVGESSGIRPALCFKDISHIGQPESVHSYRKIITPPTCYEAGFTTYSCVCGAEYNDDYTYKYHYFDGTVCTDCGYDATATCDCICHKSGVWDILWKIMETIYKVFRIDLICYCGFEHEM